MLLAAVYCCCEDLAQSAVQARSNAAECALKLVGYYQASDRPDYERILIPVGERVATAVRKEFEPAFAIVVRSKMRLIVLR